MSDTPILEDAKGFAELCQKYLEDQPKLDAESKEWQQKMNDWWEEKRINARKARLVDSALHMQNTSLMQQIEDHRQGGSE